MILDHCFFLENIPIYLPCNCKNQAIVLLDNKNNGK